MGLKLTITKEQNHLYTDFIDAYWAIEELSYDTDNCYFRLAAYPSREAKKMNLVPITDKSFPVGTSAQPVTSTMIYRWEAIIAIKDIFSSYLPLDSNVQKTMIYNFIKAHTGMPFIDVFEEENNK